VFIVRKKLSKRMDMSGKFLRGLKADNELDRLANKFETDKRPEVHNYCKRYYQYFASIKEMPIRLLEIGVFDGGSHKMWQSFFPNGMIYGVDIDEACKQYDDERIKIFVGDQADTEFLYEIMKEIGEADIIVDDGGHTMNQQIRSFKTLFPFVKRGGIYVIEDLHTSYVRNFGDCFFLDQPMTTVSYLKHLIDCVNFIGATTGLGNANVALPENTACSEQEKYLVGNILSIHFYNSICFIFKRD
jgi:hypothetical protein